MTEFLPQDAAENSLWVETAIESGIDTQLHETLQCDVLVIGGGYTGLSTALHLAEAGVDVILLEAKDIGFGGSGRNAGLVNANVWQNPDHVDAVHGPEVGERFNKALIDSTKIVFELIERYQLDCDAQQRGTVNIAHRASAVRSLENRCRQLQALGSEVEMIDGGRAREFSGSPVYCHGGILDPTAGTIQPLSYARELARAIHGLGVRVFVRSAIRSLARKRDRWVATTALGEVAAEQVVVATNAYADHNSAGMRASTLPVFIFQCATAPLPESALDSIIPQRHGLWDTQLLMTSSRIDRDGRLVMSGAGRLQSGQRALRENWMMRNRDRLYPQTAGTAWAFAWSGQVGVTSSKILRIQLLAPGVLAPAGYNGRGIAPGTVIGRHLAATIVSGNRDDFPFPIEALYREKWRALRAAYYSYGTLALQFCDRGGVKSNNGV